MCYFQEHLRRHTGETPFHCTDCPLRFKTRNTYKRHLKTRHGKLLTADGIRMMPHDDFVKIRTKQYRKSQFDHDDDDFEEDDEDQYDDEDEVENDAENTTEAPPNRLLEFCSQVVGQESS